MKAAKVSKPFLHRSAWLWVLCSLLACSHRPLSPRRSDSGFESEPADAGSPGSDGSPEDSGAPHLDASFIPDSGMNADQPDVDGASSSDGTLDGDGPAADVAESGRRHSAIGVATGDIHTCALLDDHTVKCWGDNFYGQLGYGDTVQRGSMPSQMGDKLFRLLISARGERRQGSSRVTTRRVHFWMMAH